MGPEIQAIVLDAIGPYEVMQDFAHGHGYSQLTRVKGAGGFYWVKRHQYPGKQAGEIHALRFWGPPPWANHSFGGLVA